MNNTIKEAEEKIVEDFELFDDWLDKYEYLIELGKKLDVYPIEEKIDDKLIQGCQSKLWLNVRKEGSKIYFYADSDAIITKGIISLLISVYSGREAEEIATADFSFVDKIGLKENLSATRTNGLVAMIQKIKDLAIKNK